MADGDADVGFGEDSGDHSPDVSGPGVTPGMPKSRAYDGAFFVIAIVIAIALVAVILWVKG